MTRSLFANRGWMFSGLLGLAVFGSVLPTTGAEKGEPTKSSAATSAASEVQVVEVASGKQTAIAQAGVKATAAQQYYAAKVRNNLNITVSYQYSVNGSAWKTVTLRPGYEHMFYFNLPLKGATNVYVRFDNRLGDGRLTLATAKLKFWGCSHPSQGWLHSFTLVNDMRTVALMG